MLQHHRLSHDSPSVASLKRVSSVKSLDIPVGKVEELPTPRPNTPSRLPRSRVFIKLPSTRPCVVDAVAVDCGSSGERQLITRSVPRRSMCMDRPFIADVETPLVGQQKRCSVTSSNGTPSSARFYFSDEEEEAEGSVAHIVDNGEPVSVLDMVVPTVSSSPLSVSNSLLHRRTAQQLAAQQEEELVASGGSAADILSSHVRRAVSALRSISFQNAPPEDLDTAWGQAPVREMMRPQSQDVRRGAVPSLSSRWRRPRGRISSKHGVQEFDNSEKDVNSRRMSEAAVLSRKAEILRREDVVRGAPPPPPPGQWQRKSRWAVGRDSQQSRARAARLLLNNSGPAFLAASLGAESGADANGAAGNGVTSEKGVYDGTVVEGSQTQAAPVDKYVEFIHASAAARGVRNKPRNLPSKMMDVFRRRWK